MNYLYKVGIHLYGVLIWVASFWNSKAKEWIDGRKGWKNKLDDFGKYQDSIWFHCASHGEYLQVRPVIQEWRKHHPQQPILLSYFSPSGMAAFRDYELVNEVFYLPLDTQKNARTLLDSLSLEAVVFVKSEIWPLLWQTIHERQIPLIQVAAYYDTNSAPLKNTFLRKRLKKCASLILVQDQDSLLALAELEIQTTKVTGNPRVDETIRVSAQPWTDNKIAEFCRDHKVLIAGSTWPEDMEILTHMIRSLDDWKLIIAPHDVQKKSIQKQEKSFPPEWTTQRYSEYNPNVESKILILDLIGILSLAYRYGNLAYVGGGFGAGVHNTLEPAAYGIPVLIGPKNNGFPEITKLSHREVIYPISNTNDLDQMIEKITTKDNMTSVKNKAAQYFLENKSSAARTVAAMNAYLHSDAQESI